MHHKSAHHVKGIEIIISSKEETLVNIYLPLSWKYYFLFVLSAF